MRGLIHFPWHSLCNGESATKSTLMSLRSLMTLFVGLILFTQTAIAGLDNVDSAEVTVPQASAPSDRIDIARIDIPTDTPKRNREDIGEILKYGICADPIARCTWERTFGGAQEDKAYGIATMLDDGVVVVGNRRLLSTFGQNAWILRLNRSGEIVWEREFGGRKGDEVYGVVATTDDGIVFAGNSRSRGAGKSDVWVLRLDKSGNTVWERTFGGTDDDRARSIAATADGGFVIAGFTQSRGSPEGDAFIIKIDSAGELSWEQTAGGSRNDAVIHIATMSDGGLIATGYKDLGDPKGYELWVLRLNPQGRLLWDRTFGHGIFDAGTSVVPTADGGSVVVGVTSEDAYRRDDAWVIRLDARGKVVWEQTFGGPEPETAWSVVDMRDKGYAVLVSTSSYGAGSADAWLLRLDRDGALIWERMFGGKLWDRPTSAVLTADGGIFVAGYTTTQGAGREDYWLFRLDSDGRF
jgi:uncharacterized delta-60 repeat protein